MHAAKIPKKVDENGNFIFDVMWDVISFLNRWFVHLLVHDNEELTSWRVSKTAWPSGSSSSSQTT